MALLTDNLVKPVNPRPLKLQINLPLFGHVPKSHTIITLILLAVLLPKLPFALTIGFTTN
jgi:hypothetical protein